MSLNLLKQYLESYTQNILIEQENRSQYETSVILQRERNKRYPFYALDLASPEASNLIEFNLLKEIRDGNSYIFTGAKKSVNKIYQDVGIFQPQNIFNDINIIDDEFQVQDIDDAYSIVNQDFEDLYLEFINPRSFNPGILSEEYDNVENRYNWKYIYINVNKNNLSQLSLPYIYYWDLTNEKPIINKIYSHQALPYQYVTDNLISNVVNTERLTNPLLPFFRFNNRTFRLGYYKEMLVYEYIDEKGFYGRKGQTYLSSLKPVGLDFPEGIPEKGDLEVDICYSHLKDHFPTYGFLNTDVGVYTGIKTTSQYSPIISYLYRRVDNSVFLSTAIPNTYAKEFLGFYFDPGTLYIDAYPINIFNGQKVYIEEVFLWIEEFNCINGLPDESYYDDDTIIDDTLYHKQC